MERITDFIGNGRVLYFATVGLDERPKVRPFQLMMVDGGKLWFCTSSEKKVFTELQQSPWVEICAAKEDFSWIRLNGCVVFSSDTAVKRKILESNPLVKSIYVNYDNPVFEVFYLEDGTATIADFSGQPPLVVTL